MRCLVFLITLTLSLNCQGQKINSDTMNTKSKRLPSTVNMESPILVKLEIEMDNHKIYAITTFMNVSNEDVLYDKKKMGGKKLSEEVFFAKPIPYESNLSFSPYESYTENDKPNYIIIKPKEKIQVTTDLTEHFDFKEKSCEKIGIIYSAEIFYVNENEEQIYDDDKELGLNRPIKFFCTSNEVSISYMEIRSRR